MFILIKGGPVKPNTNGKPANGPTPASNTNGKPVNGTQNNNNKNQSNNDKSKTKPNEIKSIF